jgi:hypothetical protein
MAPVDAVRLASGERPEAVTIRHMKTLAPHLANGPVPEFVFDAGYSLALRTGSTRRPDQGGDAWAA